MVGYFEYEEYRLNEMRHPLITDDEVKHQFKTFDFDGDGFVTTAELHLTSTVFYHDKEYTDQDIDAMMAEADLNCDDKASYQGTVKLDHNPRDFFLRKKKNENARGIKIGL